MEIEIVLVAVVLRTRLAREVGGFLPDGHHLQADHVPLGIVHIAEEVGDALAILARLAGQGEAGKLGLLRPRRK